MYGMGLFNCLRLYVLKLERRFEIYLYFVLSISPNVVSEWKQEHTERTLVISMPAFDTVRLGLGTQMAVCIHATDVAYSVM